MPTKPDGASCARNATEVRMAKAEPPPRRAVKSDGFSYGEQWMIVPFEVTAVNSRTSAGQEHQLLSGRKR